MFSNIEFESLYSSRVVLLLYLQGHKNAIRQVFTVTIKGIEWTPRKREDGKRRKKRKAVGNY